ncbi:flavin reductase family protein [Mycobacterium sp. ITM-2016-00317]|uniref:flavin reductase family protein n=1 Tax=Mycobacterium sp. ITM-2016-00317 TaxID=2099694 RepID=UPI000D49AC5E|nr:flavin reductase family protein [Mycobacterium sp. ITM-2016-00317]WNG85872.1 flavin reductase family protein [Mycobacterium sp. ITM-2016-00317]
MTLRSLHGQHFLPDRMEPDAAYKLISACVQPRPIAWVSTISAGGVRNLAPFSFFTVASRTPVSVMFSIGERLGTIGGIKDTLANIRATRELVVNIPAAGQADAVAGSSATVDPDVDEFDLAAVPTVPSTLVRPDSVDGALFSLECVLSQEVPVGTDVVIVARVLAVTSRRELLDDAMHIEETGFLGRLAGPYFTTEMNRVPQMQPGGPR